MEVLEIVTCSVQDNSPSLSEEKKLDTFSIHSLPVVLSQGEQAIPVTMKAEQTGHFCIIGFVARLWNKVCIDLMLEESCFVFLEIFSPIPTVDTNITLTSQYFQTNSYDILPSRNPLQNNHIFWDGERVTLHIGLQMNHCYPAPSVEYKLELVQHGADGFVEYEEEQMNQQLQEISLQLAEPGNESFQKTLCENGRCLLSSSTFISPQNFIEKRSFSCRLEFRYEAVYQKEASKMQSFRFSWMLKPWLVVSFIGLTKDVMEAEHTRYNLVLELDNWMEAPVELDIVTRTERCVSGLHLEPNECQRISFVPTHNLLSLLQQAAKDCDGSDSFDNKAIAIVTSQLECDWKCLPIQKFGRTPLRTSSRLSSCLDADLILPRANMEFCLKNEQKSSFFQVPCHVPLEVEVYITNCWWKSFPEDLCLSLKVEQATCGSWMNVMSQGVYGAGQWEDVPCGNISPGAQVIHSIQLEFISHGSYYLVAYLTSSTGPWKTVRTKALFRVQDNK